MNSCTFVGRLTKDIEVKQFGDTYKGKLSFADNYRTKVNGAWIDKPLYLTGIWWGKQVNSLQQYLTKGVEVAIFGSMEEEEWEKDGQKKKATIINVSNVQILGGRSGGQKPQQPQQGQKTQQSQYQPDESLGDDPLF